MGMLRLQIDKCIRESLGSIYAYIRVKQTLSFCFCFYFKLLYQRVGFHVNGLSCASARPTPQPCVSFLVVQEIQEQERLSSFLFLHLT